MAWEDALGRPCLSFSFDESFKLDSDQSQAEIDENFSPITNGCAPISFENRVSPLKIAKNHKITSPKDSSLLGGIFPI